MWPVLLIVEEPVEVLLQERISERIGDQIINMPVPQYVEESVDELLHERISDRISDQIIDVSVPQNLEEHVEIVESVRFISQERVHQQIGEHPVAVPAVDVPEVQILIPQGNLQAQTYVCNFHSPASVFQGTVETTSHKFDVRVSRGVHDTGAMSLIPQERVQSQIRED